MNNSFYTSLTGVQTFQQGIDVWAHNISNSNLSGYRAKRPEFANLFTDVMNSVPSNTIASSQKGYGSTLLTSQITRDQGSFSTTDSTFDLAIDGNGWFGILNQDGEKLFTRNGNFNFDKERYLVTQSGGYVTGQMAGNMQISGDATNNILTGVVEDINFATPETQTRIQLPNMLTYPQVLTSTVTVSGNLGMSGDSKTFSTTLVSPETDNLNKLSVTLNKVKSGVESGENKSSIWEFTATITDNDSKVIDKQNGSLAFDSNGKLVQTQSPSLSNSGIPITINFGDNKAGIMATNGSTETISVSKDGIPEGQLNKYGVAQDGNVIAFFDNGYKSVVAKVGVYHFKNEQGLQDIGGSYYSQTETSGSSMFYTDEAGKLITKDGLILEQTLEETNMSQAEALSELMIIQRAFDASSRALKTGDEMIKLALQMDAK